MTTFTEGPGDSVKIAVKREAARRKRTFAFYIALLLVPIAIGGYAIAKAPTETEAVAKQVIPVVNASVEESIKPRVAEAVATQAEPIIRETVAKQLDTAVSIRVKPVEERYSRLEAIVMKGANGNNDARVNELEARVAQLEKQVQILTRQLQARPDPHALVPQRPKPQ